LRLDVPSRVLNESHQKPTTVPFGYAHVLSRPGSPVYVAVREAVAGPCVGFSVSDAAAAVAGKESVPARTAMSAENVILTYLRRLAMLDRC
jgi:hypothetical protein